MKCIHVSDDVLVGGQPSPDELAQLSRQGVQSIVNLREPFEDGDPVSAREEGIRIRELGMTYVNAPVSKTGIDPVVVDDLRAKLNLLPRPLFIHCATGTRSGAVAMIDEALHRGWSGEETLRQAESLGFPCDKPELRQFVRQYVDEHQG